LQIELSVLQGSDTMLLYVVQVETTTYFGRTKSYSVLQQSIFMVAPCIEYIKYFNPWAPELFFF